MIKVLIADDHAVVRRGLRDILENQADMTVAGEAARGSEVLEMSRREHWDVAILDLAMPGKSGLDLLKQLKAERPELPVLILSVHPEEQYALRALKAGASGYMTKEMAPEQLVAAVRKVVAGGRYVSEALAQKLAGRVADGVSGPPHESLSDREFQVLRMIGTGMTVGEIARVLFLSPKTISTYRKRVLTKMGLRTSAELIHYAIRHGLADPGSAPPDIE